MAINVTGSGSTRNGNNVTSWASFNAPAGQGYYVQIRTGGQSYTSGVYGGVSATNSSTINSPQAGSRTISADLYTQPYQGYQLQYVGSTSVTVRWSAAEYTITFDASPGTTPTATKTVTYGEAYGELPTPVRSGYAFTGWYTEDNTPVTSETIVGITEDQTLYAHWEAMTIVRKVEGGSVTTYTKVYAVQSGAVKHVLSIFVVKDGIVKQAT